MDRYSYTFGEDLSVTFLQLPDFMHDFLFERDVAGVNVLRELLYSRLVGLLCAQNGAMRSHMLVCMLVQSRKLGRCLPIGLVVSSSKGWSLRVLTILVLLGVNYLNLCHGHRSVLVLFFEF